MTDSSCSTCAGGDEFGELGKKFRVAGRKDPAADSGRKDFRGQNAGPGDQGGAGRGGGGRGGVMKQARDIHRRAEARTGWRN